MFISKLRKVFVLLISVVFIIFGSVPVSVFAFDGEGSLNETQKAKPDIDDFDSIEDYLKYLDEHPDVEMPSIDEIEANANYNITINATLQYTVKDGLNCGLYDNAIQKSYKDGNNLYILQRVPISSTHAGADARLVRCTISGNVATAQDSMTLYHFGHGQTLELLDYTINGYPRFLIACTDNTQAGYSHWPTEIGMITYEPGGYTNVSTTPRLIDIQYANKDHTPYASVWRVDAALSSDKMKLVIWMKNSDSNYQYSVYNMSTIKQLLNAAESNGTYTVSCNSTSVINAFLGSYQQTESGAFLPNGSFQGLEMTNGLTMLIDGGINNQVPKVGYVYGSILSNNVYYCSWIFNATLIGNINGTNVLAANAGAEIESPQLIGDTLYVTIYRRNQAQNDGKYSIFSVPLSAFSMPMLEE